MVDTFSPHCQCLIAPDSRRGVPKTHPPGEICRHASLVTLQRICNYWYAFVLLLIMEWGNPTPQRHSARHLCYCLGDGFVGQGRYQAAAVTRACLAAALSVVAGVGQRLVASPLPVLALRRSMRWVVAQDQSPDVCSAVCSSGHVRSLPGL
jgi:hypothetical protein